MTIGRRKRSALALGLGLSCCWPATALAQDCSDKTKLLSEEWFVAKTDCGADKLVDAGVGVLSKAGSAMARAALEQYIPGISSLLFGEENPFADDFADLKDEMRTQAVRIINELMQQRSRTNSIDFIGVLDDIEDFNDDPIHLRAADLGRINHMNDVLRDLATDLMLPLAADWAPGDFSDLSFTDIAPQDVDRFHSLMMNSGLRVALIPQFTTAQFYGVLVQDPTDPSTEELAQVEDEAAAESLRDLNRLLDDLGAYLDIVNDKNLFRKRSDQRFSELASVQICGTVVRAYSKAAIGKSPSSAGSDRYESVYQDSGLHTEGSGQCYGNFSGTGSFRTVLPNGTVTTGAITAASFDDVTKTAYATDRLNSYYGFLMSAYGAARKSIARWYRQAGRVAPGLAIDRDLRDAIRRNSTSALVLDGVANNVTDAPLLAADVRAAEDLILESGNGTLYFFGLAASYADYLNVGRKQPLREVRRYLYGEASANVFAALAAAKFDAISQPY